jgi:ATP-binding cassette, subfamily B, bacterial
MVRSLPGTSALILLWTLANAAVPNLLIVVMGRVIAGLPAAIHHGMSSGAGHHLTAVLIVFGVLLCATFMLTPIQTGLSMISKVRVTHYLQRRLMEAVSTPTGIEHLEDPKVLDRLALAQGSLMSYFPGDAPMNLANNVANRLQGLVACVVIGVFRWWMGLAILILWMFVRIPQRRRTLAAVRMFSGEAGVMRRAQYFTSLATTAPAAKEVRIFGLGGWIVDQLRKHWSDGMKASWEVTTSTYRYMPILALPVFVVFALVCTYLAHGAWVGAISVSTIAVVLTLMPRTYIVGAYTIAASTLEWTLSSFPELEGLEHELRAPVIDGPSAPVGSMPRESIVFDKVTFAYPGADRAVFSELDLEIEAGRSTAVVGVNGAGKTTLVKLLGRLHLPSTGRILVDGRDLSEFSPGEWQRRIAVVFQDFSQYPVSALENITFGAIEALGDLEGAQRSAQRAGALDFLESLPRGLDTVLSRSYADGTDLSGGQWQRVALARALFATEHGAGVLVLDEPTAQLDVRGEAAFYEHFLEITGGLTTVVISHRFSTVRLADVICVLEGGKVIERGSHNELMVLRGKYAEMFAMQAARFADAEPDAEQSA